VGYTTGAGAVSSMVCPGFCNRLAFLRIEGKRFILNGSRVEPYFGVFWVS